MSSGAIFLFLVDTNIFVELMLNQEKAADCKELLERISEGSLEAVVTRFSIHSVEVILDDADSISVFLRNVEASAGLSVYDTDNEDELAVANTLNKIDLDFDDALQYFVAKKTGADFIVSFDRHFDGLDISRVEPSELREKGRSN